MDNSGTIFPYKESREFTVSFQSSQPCSASFQTSYDVETYGYLEIGIEKHYIFASKNDETCAETTFRLEDKNGDEVLSGGGITVYTSSDLSSYNIEVSAGALTLSNEGEWKLF